MIPRVRLLISLWFIGAEGLVVLNSGSAADTCVSMVQHYLQHALPQYATSAGKINHLLQHRLATLAEYSAQAAPELANVRGYFTVAAKIEQSSRLLTPKSLQDIEAIVERLAIPTLVLKGFAYTHDLYPEPRLRLHSDVDLLVAPEHRFIAHQALIAMGFQCAAMSVFHNNTSEALYLGKAAGDGASLAIDLHWQLSASYALYGRFDFDRLLAGAQKFDYSSLLKLGPVDALIHSTVHYLSDAAAERSDVSLLDTALLFLALDATEHEQLLSTAKSMEVGAIVSLVLQTSNARFGYSVPRDLLKQLESDPAGRRLRQLILNRHRHPFVLWPFFSGWPWHQAIRFTCVQIFPPRAYMDARYGLQSSLLHRHLLRSFRGLKRLFHGRY